MALGHSAIQSVEHKTKRIQKKIGRVDVGCPSTRHANMSEVLEGGKKVVSIYGIVELKLKKDFIAPMGPVLYNSYSLYNSDSLYNSYSHEHTIKIFTFTIKINFHEPLAFTMSSSPRT